jgi:hypothetical protein
MSVSIENVQLALLGMKSDALLHKEGEPPNVYKRLKTIAVS